MSSPTIPTAAADKKLIFQIRKYLKDVFSQSCSPSVPPSVSEVVDYLVNTHGEYRKKERAVVEAKVRSGLQHIGTDPGSAEGQGKGKKRGRQDIESLSLSSSPSPSPSSAMPRTKSSRNGSGNGKDAKNKSVNVDHIVDLPSPPMSNNMLNNSMQRNLRTLQTVKEKEARERREREENAIDEQDGEDNDVSSPKTASNNQQPPASQKRKIKRKSPFQVGQSSSSFDNNPSSPQPLNLSPLPSTRYSSLGGISHILQTVTELITYPLSHPEMYTHLGVEPPRGVLLHGPPGCGKSALAEAIVGECGERMGGKIGYVKVSAPEIIGGVSGESESRVREIFSLASSNAPSILFIDEVDAIVGRRDGSNVRGMEKRIVSQFLTCLDNLTTENNKDGGTVIVIGATAKPDSIDSSLRRAGR